MVQPKRPSKTTKKTARSNNIWTKSDVRSKRLIIVVLLFAIIGGGLIVFRSFAASPVIVAHANQITADTPPATKISDTDSSKNTFPAWAIGNGGGVSASTISMVPYQVGQTFNICSYVKAAKSGVVTINFGIGKLGGSIPMAVKATGAYTKFCVPLSYLGVYSTYHPSIVNNTGANIRVSSISIEYNAQFASGAVSGVVSGSN